MTENSLKNFSDSKISIIRSRLMARSLYLGGLETRDFAKMCSDNFYKKWKSFKLRAFLAFVQFRKGQQGGVEGGGSNFESWKG